MRAMVLHAQRERLRLEELPMPRTLVEAFRLEQANDALDRLRAGAVRGAPVLAIESSL
jgi:hypothetical protein